MLSVNHSLFFIIFKKPSTPVFLNNTHLILKSLGVSISLGEHYSTVTDGKSLPGGAQQSSLLATAASLPPPGVSPKSLLSRVLHSHGDGRRPVWGGW